MRFLAPCIPHYVAVMVLYLAFYTKDPNGVEDAINVFLLPELSPHAGSEAALLTQRWYAVFGVNTFTSISGTSPLMGRKKVVPVTS